MITFCLRLGEKDDFVVVDEPLVAVNPNATKSNESLLTGTGINQHYLFLIEQVFNYLTLLVIFSLLDRKSVV